MRVVPRADPRPGRPQNAWEPVIYSGGRAVAGGRTRRLDVLQHHARPRLTDPARVIGAKPAVFCRWVFDLLGARAGDHFDDLYPGSGGIARAWAVFNEQAVARDLHDASTAAGGDASLEAAATRRVSIA